MRANDSVAIVVFAALWELCRCEGDGWVKCDVSKNIELQIFNELELRELRRSCFGSAVVIEHNSS
jgi:hypothetical protein